MTIPWCDAKVVGQHTARHFEVPAIDRLGGDAMTRFGGSGGQLEDAIGPILFWVDCVPEGSAVLLAIMGLDIERVRAVLAALAPLGVPQDLKGFALPKDPQYMEDIN